MNSTIADPIDEWAHDRWNAVERTTEIGLRQEVSSLIHSRLRTRALMAQSAAAAPGVPTRVRSLITRLVNEIEQTRQEVMGAPTTGLLADVLRRHAAGFEGHPCIEFSEIPDLDLGPMDHDVVITVLLDLVTNAAAAGAQNVRISVAHDVATGLLSMSFDDDGKGLDHEPWHASDELDRSTYILDQMLGRRGGGLELLPSDIGATVSASWRMQL